MQMTPQQNNFRAIKRKVAWMFLALWSTVLILTLIRYCTHGDMVVTLGVAAAAVLFSLYRLWDAYRREK